VTETINLDRLASIVEELPTLPNVMFEVLAIAEDDKSTAADLEEVIMRDQALSAKVLKVANSAYYGIPRTVETVSRATVLLGFQTVVGLALTVSVYDTLWGSGKGHYLDRRDLWKHSLGVATSARLLSNNARGKDGAVAFTAGMLHDIGKTVFDSHLAEEYGKVVEMCHRDRVTIHDAEMAILGIGHAELGSKVALRWQLPEVLCEAVKYHHSPAAAPGDKGQMGALVSMADFLTRQCAIGECGDTAPAVIQPDALRIWGGTQEKLQTAAEELERYRDKIELFQT
jgi:putative nucleotidyltransferase with HDIG domain